MTKSLYVAVAIKDNYTIVLSKPCNKYKTQKFKGAEIQGETFKVMQLNNLISRKNIIGEEYLKIVNQ